MKYYYEEWNYDTKQNERKQITEKQAKRKLETGYINIDEIIKLPCYYPLCFGAVIIKED